MAIGRRCGLRQRTTLRSDHGVAGAIFRVAGGLGSRARALVPELVAHRPLGGGDSGVGAVALELQPAALAGAGHTRLSGHGAGAAVVHRLVGAVWRGADPHRGRHGHRHGAVAVRGRDGGAGAGARAHPAGGGLVRGLALQHRAGRRNFEPAPPRGVRAVASRGQRRPALAGVAARWLVSLPCSRSWP